MKCSVNLLCSTCLRPVSDLTSKVVLIANMVIATRATALRLAGAAGVRAYAETGASQNAVHNRERSMPGPGGESSGERERAKRVAQKVPRTCRDDEYLPLGPLRLFRTSAVC